MTRYEIHKPKFDGDAPAGVSHVTHEIHFGGPHVTPFHTEPAWLARMTYHYRPRLEIEDDGFVTLDKDVTDGWAYFYPSLGHRPPVGLRKHEKVPEGWTVEFRRKGAAVWKHGVRFAFLDNYEYRYKRPAAAAPAPVTGENPKARHGAAKPNLALIPGAAQLQIAEVFALGAAKYGAFNWRKDAVQAETYVAAAQRHLLSWFDGEDVDPESGQPHIAHVAACMMILLDAAGCKKLDDNRPHKGVTAELIRSMTKPVTK